MSLRAVIWCAVSSKDQARDEKASLHEQEREGRELAKREGWDVIDVLIVSGHTRNYIDFYEMAADSLRDGIDAFQRLQEHWKRKDFDVLIVRDGDRLAREQAPVAFMIGFIIKAGARIFSMQDGWIDERNHRTTGMFIGYRAAAEVEQLKVKMKQGKDYKFMSGVHSSGRVPFGFLSIRGDNGKLIRTDIDHRYDQFFLDVAELLLTHVKWLLFEEELYQRYGHVDPRTNQPFRRKFFYHWFHVPWLWGHSARQRDDSPNRQSTGPWVWGDTRYPVPDGILFKHDTHEPLYKGALADQLKAELLRRRLFTGGARPNNAHPFTGLLLCGYCGYSIVCNPVRKGFPEMYRCRSKFTAQSRPGCAVERYVRADAVQAWFNAKLVEMLVTGDAALLARDDTIDTSLPNRLSAIAVDMAAVNEQISILIDKQATAPAALSTAYDARLAALAERLTLLQARQTELEGQLDQIDMPALMGALDDLRAIGGTEALWALPENDINVFLHRFMGHRRAVVRDGKVTGTASAPPHPRYKHGNRAKRRAY